MFIGDWLGRRAQLTPTKVALVDATDNSRRITYQTWAEAVQRTARFLTALGVVPGDRVAVLAHNCVAYLDIWFACGRLGAILQPLNWRMTPQELGPLIADAQPRVLAYGPEHMDQTQAVRDAGGQTMVGVALDAHHRAAADDHGLDDRDRADLPPLPRVDLDWDDPWALCYTGGTTGPPKGAILTHGNITWNAVNTTVSWGLTPSDVAILNAPLFHTGGLNVLTAPLAHLGGTSIICRAFDPDQVFDLVRDAGVTLLFGVPTMFLALQAHPRWATADLSRLRLIISGGAPCPPPVFDRFRERGLPFRTGYGLTEAGPNTFWLPDADVARKPGSVGFPLLHVDVSIVDPQGQECVTDQVGELRVRGPHVSPGYWGRPEETSRSFRDGWLHTGDLARRDAEGHHHIVGRIKDLIISGGENIYPVEVEAALTAHPAVAEVAVIGAAHETWGEVPWAVVVPRPGHELDSVDLLAFAAQRLARFKLPRAVALVESLPRTAAGKVDKEALRQAHGQP